MAQPWVVRITPEGDVQTLWHDALDLEDLGHCEVERVSNVEWVEDGWEITWAKNNMLMTSTRFAKRADALAREVEVVFDLLSQGETF